MRSPLVGYNTNVRHKGKVYHIQTEDSGVSHPHIITHLFADGGRIVASRKTGYAEHVGTADYESIVKKMMQDQHKAMFIALRDGQFDEAESLYAAATTGKGPAAHGPGAAAAAPAPAASAPSAATPQPTPASPPGLSGLAAAAVARATGRPPPAGPGLVGSPPSPGAAPRVPAPAAPMLDVAALERAAAERERESATRLAGEPAKRESRYQTTQPARIVRPPRRAQTEPPPSIFGGDMLSEKSLDEVILSYLSEDTEEK